MKFAVALLTLVGCAGSSMALNPASAEWLRYTDPRFQTSTLYPSDLLSERTATETGATFTGTGAYLEISAADRGIFSVAELTCPGSFIQRRLEPRGVLRPAARG